MGEGETDDIEVKEDEGDKTDPNSTFPKHWLTKDQRRNWCKPFRRVIIIKLLGKSVGYVAFRQRLNAAWHLKEDVSPVYVGNGFYVVRFWHKEDYERVMTGGPWTVLGHYLTVQRWRQSFESAKERVATTRVWVRFSGLPLKMFSEECVGMLASDVGKNVRFDAFTLNSAKGVFARAIVKIDLSKPLLSHVWLDNMMWEIKYESLDSLCFTCGGVGHSREVCSGEVAGGVGEDVTAREESKGKDEGVVNSGKNGRGEAKYGPWMLVSQRGRRTRLQDHFNGG